MKRIALKIVWNVFLMCVLISAAFPQAAFSAQLPSSSIVEEYTIMFTGTTKGFIMVQKEANGRIVITPHLSEGMFTVDNSICPLLPSTDYFMQSKTTAMGGFQTSTGPWPGFFIQSAYQTSIVIDGNTTTTTYRDGKWDKTVINGNTTTTTSTQHNWLNGKTVVEGNTTTSTDSDGDWEKVVVNGNTRLYTNSYGSWRKVVIEGNTTTETNSDGGWEKTVVNGNTISTTSSSDYWTKTVIEGNTTTFTSGNSFTGSHNGSWRMVVEGNTVFIHTDQVFL